MNARPRAIRTGSSLAVLLLLAGCAGEIAPLNPAGTQAQRISEITWFLIALGTAVYAGVMGFLGYALWRGSRRAESAGGPEVERRLTRWVVGGVGATIAILLVLLVHTLATGRAIALSGDPDALTIRVVAHQWWWEVVYEDPQPHRRLSTANEIRIPVGRSVRIRGESRDVIHSFWPPSLQGKVDLIPGYTTTTHLRAERPGVYRGRCAEFCGMQHAKMDFLIIAEEPERFAAWYERQLQPAREPADSLERRGQQVFLTRNCVLCHTVRGTVAGSRVGPDLTHLGSRRTLAAGVLPNQRGNLAGWVSDPQRIKPGAHMPPTQMDSGELIALVAYLESLR